jgi:hypothetical protein
VLPYFRYLGTGLSLVLMFIGVKMLAAHWIEIPTHIALGVVGGVLAVAVAASLIAGRAEARAAKKTASRASGLPTSTGAAGLTGIGLLVSLLAAPVADVRSRAAAELHRLGEKLSAEAIAKWRSDLEFASLLQSSPAATPGAPAQAIPTVGVAVFPASFESIRAANGSPRMVEVPPDQDAAEFELHSGPQVRLDILTTNAPGGAGAIAKFLGKFGEGIQQVEYEVRDVDRATEILRTKFGQHPVYPATRGGADGTRVNSFLVATPEGNKVLIELVEVPHRITRET